MTIRENTIKKYGKPFYEFPDTYTLKQVEQHLANLFDKLGDIYVVARQSKNQYRVAQWVKLRKAITSLGLVSLGLPLNKLPNSLFPLADEVIYQDVEESGRKVYQRACDQKRKILIVASDRVIGLFDHTPRSAVSLDSSDLSRLHGGKLPFFDEVLPKPCCPHCKHQNYYGISADGQECVCKKCGEVIPDCEYYGC